MHRLDGRKHREIAAHPGHHPERRREARGQGRRGSDRLDGKLVTAPSTPTTARHVRPRSRGLGRAAARRGSDRRATRLGFRRWLAADPANARAFDRASAVWASVGGIAGPHRADARPRARRAARCWPAWARRRSAGGAGRLAGRAMPASTRPRSASSAASPWPTAPDCCWTPRPSCGCGCATTAGRSGSTAAASAWKLADRSAPLPDRGPARARSRAHQGPAGRAVRQERRRDRRLRGQGRGRHRWSAAPPAR
jgi:hypothetical protein